MPREIKVEVYDAALQLQAISIDGVQVDATRCWHRPDTATLTGIPGTKLNRMLRGKNACVRVLVDEKPFVTGRVVSAESGRDINDPVTANVVGHWARLSEMLVWPSPTQSLTNQAAHWTMTGPTERVVKTLVTQQSQRLGGHVITATIGDSGPTVTVSGRWVTVADLIAPTLQTSGLRCRVDHVPGTGLVMTSTPTINVGPRVDVDSDVFIGGKWAARWPTTTRTIVGGQGELAARTMYGPTIGAEDSWRMETFVDARDVEAGANANATFAQRAAAKLDEDKQVQSIADCQLSETSRWRWGSTHDVGDAILIDAWWDANFAPRVESARLTANENGTEILTQLGAWSSQSGWGPIVVAVLEASGKLRRIEGAK